MTQNIKYLSTEINQHIELMAQNVHEQWATGRAKDGWKFGKERNDELKEHPGLVAYDELPEVEKEYDRQTVIATLTYLVENGYEIRKKE